MIDFGRIGDIISKNLDSDYIDIKRDISGKLQEVYSNIPCHVAYSSVDNPDPTSVDIKPIIQSLTVHCQLWVDVRNNDFIIAKKVGSDGSLIAVYSGRCGNPVVSQGRKKVMVTMSATEPDEPTPLPPPESVKVSVSYVYGVENVKPSEVIDAEIGSSLLVMPPIVEGYSISECWIDGELQESTEAYIDEVSKDGNTVRFVYGLSDVPASFRFLVNGLFTKDDGRMASGWHQYKKVSIYEVVEVEGVYTITSDDEMFVHEDNGKALSVTVGTKIVIYPGAVFAAVSEILGRDDGRITFKAASYVPTEAESDSYICGWY